MRQIRELKQVMGNQAYANRRAIQNEYVPIILQMMYKDLKSEKHESAVQLLDSLGITNEMMKEHLLDLCMNNKMKEDLEKLSPAQKSAFTRYWN